MRKLKLCWINNYCLINCHQKLRLNASAYNLMNLIPIQPLLPTTKSYQKRVISLYSSNHLVLDVFLLWSPFFFLFSFKAPHFLAFDYSQYLSFHLNLSYVHLWNFTLEFAYFNSFFIYHFCHPVAAIFRAFLVLLVWEVLKLALVVWMLRHLVIYLFQSSNI